MKTDWEGTVSCIPFSLHFCILYKARLKYMTGPLWFVLAVSTLSWRSFPVSGYINNVATFILAHQPCAHQRELSQERFLEGAFTRSAGRKAPLKPQIPSVLAQDCEPWAWVLLLLKRFLCYCRARRDDCRDRSYHSVERHSYDGIVCGDNHQKEVCLRLERSWRVADKQSGNQCFMLTVMARLGSLKKTHLPKRT